MRFATIAEDPTWEKRIERLHPEMCAHCKTEAAHKGVTVSYVIHGPGTQPWDLVGLCSECRERAEEGFNRLGIVLAHVHGLALAGLASVIESAGKSGSSTDEVVKALIWQLGSKDRVAELLSRHQSDTGKAATAKKIAAFNRRRRAAQAEPAAKKDQSGEEV